MEFSIERLRSDEFRYRWRHWAGILLDADKEGKYPLSSRHWLLVAAAVEAEDWDVVADLYLDHNGPMAEQVAALARGTK